MTVSTPHEPIVLPLPDTETLPSSEPTEDDDVGIGALRTDHGNLPLRRLSLRAIATGLSARMVLTQHFRNPYDEPLEATYVFPLPDRAAVTGLRMTADARTVEGQLHERAQARATYDKAVAEGQRASITEEERPGVFTMRVGNILPDEDVSCELHLDGPLPYEDGQATLQFPLVVAPRYIPGAPLDTDQVGSGTVPDTDAVPDASRITPPVLLPGFPHPVELSIETEIDPAGLPLSQVRSSLHAVDAEVLDEATGRMRVRVHPGQRADRDFILRWRLGAAEQVRSSLTLVPDPVGTRSDQAGDACEPAADSTNGSGFGTASATHTKPTADSTAEGELGSGTFALTVVPPQTLRPARPRDVVLVLDRSGSMGGPKMVTARRAAARIIDTLGSTDRFAVLTFDSTLETPPRLPEGLVPATDRHRFRAVDHLGGLSARGGTEMLAPLRRAADLLAGTESAVGESTSAEDSSINDTSSANTVAFAPHGRERTIVLVTDGQVGNEDEILAELCDRLHHTRVHTVGVDAAVNSGFLHRLAALGGGRYELVESEDRLDEAMENIHRRIGTPVLTDLDLEPSGLRLVTDTVAPRPLPALYAGAPLVVTGRYHHLPTQPGDASSVATMTMRARTPDEDEHREQLTARECDNTAVTSHWARAHLRDLEDRYATLPRRRQNAEDSAAAGLEQRIVKTSLRFGVLCRFTAFVAVDSRIVTDATTPRRVTQPVEQPYEWNAPSAAAGPSSVRSLRAAPPGTASPSAAPAGPTSTGPTASAPGWGAPTSGGTSSHQYGDAARAGQHFVTGRGPQGGGTEEWGVPQTASPHLNEPAIAHAQTRLANERDRLAGVSAHERRSALQQLVAVVTEVVTDLETAGAPEYLLRPLRELATDLPARWDAAPAELARAWTDALDVLQMVTTLPGPGSRSQRLPAAGSTRPRSPRCPGPFWKR